MFLRQDRILVPEEILARAVGCSRCTTCIWARAVFFDAVPEQDPKSWSTFCIRPTQLEFFFITMDEEVTVESLRRSARIAALNNASITACRNVKPRYNHVFVSYTDDSEHAFLMTAQRAVAMFDVAAVTAFLNRPDKTEDVACSLGIEEEAEVTGDEVDKVSAVPVSFDDESDEVDDDDGENTKKLASPLSSNTSSDDGYYGDLRSFVQRHCQRPVIDLSKLRGSDFSSDSETSGSKKDEQE